MTEEPRSVDARTWDAILHRDPEADGLFVYAVRSTGIYCRPTCPSRRPRREVVEVFASVEDAAHAGFRPCKRCAPDGVTRHQQAIARIQHLLETTVPTPTLGDLGAAVGLTPSHVQRMFKRRTGLSPRQYAAAVKAERLQARLQRGERVTPAQYEAGYGSSHALYRTSSDDLGMTPGRYRKGGEGEIVYYGFVDTPHGRIMLAATEKGVCALRFGPDEQTTAELADEFPNATLRAGDARLDPLLRAVRTHLSRMRGSLLLPLDVEATAFRRRVWTALRRIPLGETRSYRDVAEMIGSPTAIRAVARACAANPVALVVPCHRIVRASGELSGYRWGTDRKRDLLEDEAASVRS